MGESGDRKSGRLNLVGWIWQPKSLPRLSVWDDNKDKIHLSTLNVLWPIRLSPRRSSAKLYSLG